MYKYKSWDDENKKFGSASNEIGKSWSEANDKAKKDLEQAQKQQEEKQKAQAEQQLKLDQNKPAEAPGFWDKSADFVAKTASKLKNWYDDYSFRMNEKSLLNPGRDQNYVIDEKGKLKAEYPRLEKYNQAKTEEEKAQIRSEAVQSTAEKTPLIRWLNSDTGKAITGEVAKDTSNLPLKLVASIKAIGDDTYDEAYSALMAERNDPTNPRWQKILYGIQDSGPQSAIGTLLAVGTSLLSRNPQAGQAVAMTYFAAISAESQRQEKGQVSSLGNIAIDTVGDTILSGVAEAALKSVVKEGGEAGVKEFLKQTGKGFVVEGTTEPSQTFLKYANDYKNAKTEEQKQAVVADLTGYVKNGGMVDEFLIGGISGGLITATATGAGMVAGKGKGEVNPSLQPNKATIGGAGTQEEAPKEKPTIKAELDTDFSKVRDSVVDLEKKIETTTDENALNELVGLQDQLNDYQNAVKERPVYISDNTQGSPLAEIETVQYPDGKFAFRFSADVDTASVSGNFSNTELFKSKDEAVKAGGQAILEWAKHELVGADEATTTKLNEMTAQVQDVIEGKNVKPSAEEFVQKKPEEYAPGLANFDTSEEINANYVSKVKESQTFEEFKKGLDQSTIMSRIAPDVESDNRGAVENALKAFYNRFKTSDNVVAGNESPSANRDLMNKIESTYDNLKGKERTKAIEKGNVARDKFNAFTKENSETVFEDKNVSVKVVKFDDGKWAYSVSVNTNTSGMSRPFSGEFDTKAEAINKAIKNIEGFIAGNEDSKDIPAIKKAVEQLKKESAKPENNKSEVVKTQKEKVAESIKEKPKTIKEIAEETKIKEPNIRRILGVGAKEGTFERVEKGVYILSKDGQDIAFIHPGDALEVLPKLAKDGLKADMIFLDIPYKTPAVTGGNRGVKFETISVEEFKTVMDAISTIARDEKTPLYYMYSKAPSGLKKMLQYNDVLIEKGFKPVAEGGLTKTQKDGLTVVRNMRGAEIPPEGIILLTKSGKFDEIDEKRKLDFKLIRPKGYQTEKPAELLASLIKQGTKEGDVVLDPFAGSGVTGAEAIKSGRKAVLVEKNQNAIDNFIKPRLQEAIKTNETELQKVLTENKDKVEQAMSEIFTELDIAEAGQKIFIDTSANNGPGNIEVLGIKSTFPQWIPEEYRSKKLFDKVMGGMFDIENISFPDKNKTKQRAFYNLLLDEVDNRAGIDTAKIREDIINNYDKIYAKETTTQDAQEAQPKESASGSTQGSQEEIKGIPTDKAGMFLRDNMEGFTNDLSKTKQIYDSIKKIHPNYWQEELDRMTSGGEINVDDIFAHISKGQPNQINYSDFGHWADMADEAKTIKEFKESVVSENLTEDFKKFAQRRDEVLTDEQLTEIARNTIINEFKKRTGMTFDEFFKNVKADSSFYENLNAINDPKKLDTLLSTQESKQIMSQLIKETNPNLRAFLTLNLYKEITTQDLKDRGLYQGGWFDSKTNTVAVARDMTAEQFAYTFKHEVGHAAFSSLPMKEKNQIVEWYRSLTQKELVSLYGNETTLNDYIENSKNKRNADEYMADETVQRQMDQKNKVDSTSKMLKPLRDLITKIVLALNKISKKILPSMAQRLKVQRLFQDVFSQTGGEKFAKSQAYLDELKLKGFREGTIKDMETGFSTKKLIDFSGSVNAEEKTDEKVAKEFSEQYGYKPTYYAKGQFADFEEKYGEGIGGLEHIKPLELPELVKMVKEVTGKVPEVKSRFRGNRFGDAQPGSLRIRILASLFSEDKIREAKAVLAHELGHIVDFMPDGINRGGNILGRIATISKYLKHTIPGDSTLNSKSIRNELIALSEYWHPYDKSKASEYYKKYRESSVEIYADAMSVLFNSPGLLQEKAPVFYDAFFKFLDRKPAVKQSFFELQSLLEGNREEVIKARQSDLREGFAKAEEIIKDKYEAKKAGNKNFWARMRQQLDDQNYEIIKKQREYEANGEVYEDKKNPKFLLDELPFVDNENYLLLDDMNKDVVQPIELAGMTMGDMGEYLVLNRIMNDRSDIANPYGFTPDSAKEQLSFMKKSIGEENFKMLEEKMAIFHEKVFASVEEAVKVGSYNKELFDTTIEPNKNTYAAFRVVDYIDENMPAGIKKQVGTFKEIGNPFTATIIKTLSLNRLNAYQRAKSATIEMLSKNGEAEKSKSITTDGKLRIFKPAKGKGTIEMLEDGKFTSYDVDPYIAERFDRDTIGEVNRLVAAVDMFNNNLFKPLVTTYNMGFALAFNPIRDFKRNYKSIKNASVLNLLSSYIKSMPEAYRYARKAEMSEFTRSLVENKSIMAPINDYNFDAREDEFGKMLERYGLIKVDEKTSKLPKVVRKVVVGNVVRVLEAMRLASNTFEIVSKIAGAKVRLKGGEFGKSLYQNVRDYTGTPNWTRKGQHTRTTNAIFVFSNIMKEGMKSDYITATSPETRAGYWWKTVKVDLLPKVLQFAASAGIIDALFGLSGGGDDEDKDGPIKKFFAKISEYDKSNYLIIPLGTNSEGKAVYMRIPHDETGRMISAALWKMMNFAKDRELSQMQDIFAIGAGQLPSVSPAIGIASNWVQFLSGRNPYDDFRGRPLIDDTTFQAGGWPALKKMLQWTTNTMGVTAFATYDSSKDTTIETTLRLTPLFNRLIKVSDYGLQEQEYKKMDKANKEKARETLQKKDTIKTMIKDGAETEDIVNAVAKELEIDPTTIPGYKRVNLLRTEVKKEQIRQRTGSKTDMLLKAGTNENKVNMLKKFKLEMDDQTFQTYLDDLYENKVISANVYEQI